MARVSAGLATWAIAAIVLPACGGREHLEPLGVVSASPRGRWRVEMMLRTGGRQKDAWVARVGGSTGRPTDVVLPSFPSNEGERTVTRRKPRLVWDRSEDRVLVETIGSAFLVLYTPPGDPPFFCQHRLVDPIDAHMALSRTPTLTRLEEEILTEDDKPHDADEQEYVLRRLERAGPASESGHVLLTAVLRSSKAIDRNRILRLATSRLRPDSGLSAPVRSSELARLRGVFDEFGVRTDHEHAGRVARAIELLGALPPEEGAHKVPAALEAAVGRATYATGTAEVIDSIGPLAWLAGKWELTEASPSLVRYLTTRDEVPWKTRVTRNLALWAATRLGEREAIAAILPLLDEPAAWLGGSSDGRVPDDGEADASPAWADGAAFGTVAAWAAARLGDARAIPPLRRALGRDGVPVHVARSVARALLSRDATGARATIRASVGLDDAAKQELLQQR